ncbi:MAG: peptidylprolyl isomerase [Pseudomonadota bacterium]
MIRSPAPRQALLATAAMLALMNSAAQAQDTTTETPDVVEETAPATEATPDAPLPPSEDAAEEAVPEIEVDAGTVLATVNGTEITMGLLHYVFTQLPAQYQQYPGEILFPALLDQAVNQVLLAQAGAADGIGDRIVVQIATENANRDAIAGTFVNEIVEREVTEEAIRAEYDTRVAALPDEAEVNASHILVASEDEAKAVIEALNGGADFAETAKEKSTGPSGPNGGLLGWFGKGQMVGPFEEAVFALEPGQISAPVETQFGWHVIMLNESRVKPKPEFDALREQIAGELGQALIRARIEELRASAEISQSIEGVPVEAIRDGSLLTE